MSFVKGGGHSLASFDKKKMEKEINLKKNKTYKSLFFFE